MSALDKSKLDGIAAGAKTGTVTSVAVKMNGETKGTITTSGTIDLGTVITAHQDISGKQDKSNLVTTWSQTLTDTKYPSEKLVKTDLNSINTTLTSHGQTLVQFDEKFSEVDGYIEGLVEAVGTKVSASVSGTTLILS